MSNGIANMKWQVMVAGILSFVIFSIRILVLAISYNPHTFDSPTWLFNLAPIMVFPTVLLWKLSRRISLVFLWFFFAVSYVSLVVGIWHSCLIGKCIPGTSFIEVALTSFFVAPHIIGLLVVAGLMQWTFNSGQR